MENSYGQRVCTFPGVVYFIYKPSWVIDGGENSIFFSIDENSVFNMTHVDSK